MATEENDWHWLAGIFEGEGSASCSTSGYLSHPRLQATVGQSNKDMLVEVQRIAGCGCICAPKRKDHHKQSYLWCCSNKMARNFFTVLLPYIRSPHKLEQVKAALDKDRIARQNGREAQAKNGRRNIKQNQNNVKAWETRRRNKAVNLHGTH